MNGINSNLNFAGKYRLNANQTMPDEEACLKRDYMLGTACSYAKNGQKAAKQLENFYKDMYKKNPSAPCNLELDFPDDMDAIFETSMSKVGQNFDKLA